MRWFHTCSLNWLRARQRYLTATDVKELLPITKTGRSRTVTDEMYLKVLARKEVYLTVDDCVSTGVMARGHILEPYAIDRYNKEDYGNNEWLYHWDDIIVTRNHATTGSLAFSPDAMNINPEGIHTIVHIDTSMSSEPVVIGEVKSYAVERHIVCGHTPKENLEERWQVATAMAVCNEIETGYLLFYNPSVKEQLFIIDYSRSDLEDEISMINQVEGDWMAFLDSLSSGGVYSNYTVMGNVCEEYEIIHAIMKKEELNPDNEKSVML